MRAEFARLARLWPRLITLRPRKFEISLPSALCAIFFWESRARFYLAFPIRSGLPPRWHYCEQSRVQPAERSRIAFPAALLPRMVDATVRLDLSRQAILLFAKLPPSFAVLIEEKILQRANNNELSHYKTAMATPLPRIRPYQPADARHFVDSLSLSIGTKPSMLVR